MVSKSHINFPANEDEPREEFYDEENAAQEHEEKPTAPEEESFVDEPSREGETPDEEPQDETCEDIDADELFDEKSGRFFGISPEEFCGDPYEQQGHVETRQELGKRGEEAAVKYLIARGFEIIKRNWFCRFGEADIIARDLDGTICFIEVKTRRSVEAGFPEEAITPEKRRRYERIALCYMMVNDDWDDNECVRFDAIGICVTGPHRAMLRHHRSCFNAYL